MPTFTHGKDARFKIADSNGAMQDISAMVNKVDLQRQADTAEVSAFGDKYKAYIPGLIDATISFEGMTDVTLSGYFDDLLGELTTWEFYPGGEDSGQIKYEGSGMVTSLEQAADIGGAITCSGELQVAGEVVRTLVP